MNKYLENKEVLSTKWNVNRLEKWSQGANAAYRVAETLVQSSFVSKDFRQKPIEAAAAILAGAELGLQPMAALKAFDIIRGQAAPRAIMLRAVCQAAGHEIVLVESTASKCKMSGRRKDSQQWQHVMWTIDRAKQQQIVSNENWVKQPQAMLVARATAELCRLIAADALLGIGYSSEELLDDEALLSTTGATNSLQQPKKRVLRRKEVQRPQQHEKSQSEVKRDTKLVDTTPIKGADTTNGVLEDTLIVEKKES